MLSIVKDGFNRHFVGMVTIRNNSGRISVFVSFIKHRNGLWGIPVRRQMKTDNKPCFTVNHEPDIVLNTSDFNHRFIHMPFVRIQI